MIGGAPAFVKIEWMVVTRLQRGFTLIELLVVVAITGLLSSTAVPAFIKYTRKAKTAEARQNVRKIYDGARAYYLEPRYASVTDMNPLPASYPAISNAPFENTGDAAHISCCARGGVEEKCVPDANLWIDPRWVSLHFSMPDAHYYAYEYWAETMVVLHDAFGAEARGDLDCDSLPSYFHMWGFVSADGVPWGNGLLKRYDELE
jgi:prepilin-type N-terminal cleavage/methylation domain-containing protein